MSWEKRGDNRYYYRRRKVNGRVIAEYIGTGDMAEAIARADEHDRRRRQRAAAEFHALAEGERRQGVTLAEVNELGRSAVAGVLIANGYHMHKRQWRKRRDELTY